MKKIILIQILFLFISGNCISANLPGKVKTSKKNSSITIRIYYDKARNNDTLILFYYENILSGQPQPGIDKSIEMDARQQKDRSFKFNFKPGAQLGYFWIEKKFKAGDIESRNGVLMYSHLAEKGDNITIKISFAPKYPKSNSFLQPMNMKYDYSGISAKKYNAMQLIDSAIKNAHGKGGPIFDKQFIYNPNALTDNKITAGLLLLDRSKQFLDKALFEQLKANIFYGEERWIKYVHMADLYKTVISKKSPDTILLFRKRYSEMSNADECNIPVGTLFKSDYYAKAQMAKLIADDYIFFGSKDFDRVLVKIESNYKGIIRDKLIAAFLQERGGSLNDYSRSLRNASAIVNSPYAAGLLAKLKNHLAGTMAYDFHLPAYNGKFINLSNLRGKIVFVDFWYTGCTHCADYYANGVSKAESYFKADTNVIFVTISIDKDVALWKKSVKSGTYTSPNVINLYTNGEGSQHPIIKKYFINSYPNPILVGRDGRILKYGNSGLRNDDSRGP